MPRYPDCFPDDFEKRILPNSATCQDVDVYRIAKSGINERKAFWGSYEESIREPTGSLRAYSNKNAGDLSTSCWTTRKQVNYWLRMMKRKHNPSAIRLAGVTKACCGPSLVEESGHVHWWIYNDSNPCEYFREDDESESDVL